MIREWAIANIQFFDSSNAASVLCNEFEFELSVRADRWHGEYKTESDHTERYRMMHAASFTRNTLI